MAAMRCQMPVTIGNRIFCLELLVLSCHTKASPVRHNSAPSCRSVARGMICRIFRVKLSLFAMSQRRRSDQLSHRFANSLRSSHGGQHPSTYARRAAVRPVFVYTTAGP
ncbi:hypothetical protein IWX49DRAFT_178449 [Phyllosticta citricarpa]